ncbi:MAG: deoxyguanosinetriphosphate triphosphohydrolase-like protein [Chloroflexota bacterium]|nr:MAG: deoxyguanosinetriphosphate triphosphohydrolase-like protein [Chloroflexota bacterium]
MLVTTQELETREQMTLAPYAMPNSASRGRVYPEAPHPYRLGYQRDRDRIIHTTAFRRLEYKTQVFVYSEGDHYRNRLTHSVEVAQIGRTLARALGCNEDLTEAICLAHDLGHPPFGHVGEETLNQLMAEHGGFDHQRQTYRILTELEHRYPDHPGLNLTYEVLEGVVKHDTDYDVVDANAYHPEERGTLECQLSNLADEIAYNTSDLDDGLRSGILDPAQVKTLTIAQRTLRSLGMEQDADLRTDLVRYRFIRRLVGIEVSDVVSATAQKITETGITSLDELRAAAENVACYSSALAAENQELKRFLFQNFYRHYRVARMAAKAARTINRLFEAYISEPRQLPFEVQMRVANSNVGLHRVVCDYLAGMTDRYAIQEYRRLYDIEERA